MVGTSIVSVNATTPNVITVNSLGTDDLHSFAINDWVENRRSATTNSAEQNGSSPKSSRLLLIPSASRSLSKRLGA